MTSPTVADAFGDLFSVSNDGSSVLELTNVGTVAAPIYSSAPNILATFNALITGGLTVDAHGDVLGATGPDYSTNPPRNYGALFEIKNLGAAAAPVFATSPTTLYAFPTRGFGGANPIGGMVLDAKGDLFGATLNGGLYGDGTVFEIKNLGGLDAPNYATAPTTLFTFIGGDDNGAHPISLAADSNGVLYGATASGGTFRSADVTVTQVVNGITHTYPHMSVGTGFVVPIAPVIAGTVSGQGTAGGPVTPLRRRHHWRRQPRGDRYAHDHARGRRRYAQRRRPDERWPGRRTLRAVGRRAGHHAQPRRTCLHPAVKRSPTVFDDDVHAERRQLGRRRRNDRLDNHRDQHAPHSRARFARQFRRRRRHPPAERQRPDRGLGHERRDVDRRRRFDVTGGWLVSRQL
jgi:uncharacterized repeat protein (TIGR03803 family)